MLGRGPAPPVRPDWFTADELARLHRALAPAPGAAIDDATWQDLELGRYLDLLGRRSSIAARQVLFHRLRSAGSLPREDTVAVRLRATDDADAAAPANAALETASAALQPLRWMDTEVASVLFGDAQPSLPAWVHHLWAVPLGFAAAAGLFAAAAVLGGGLVLTAAVLVLAAAVLVSGRVQIVLHAPLQQWQRQRRALLALVRAALAVNAARAPGAQPGAASAAASKARPAALAHPLLHDVLAQHASARALLRQVGPRWTDQVPGLAEYANLLALTQYRRFSGQLAALREQRAAWQQLFMTVAGLEADLAVHAHLQFAQGTCVAEPAAGRTLVFDALTHPLLHPAHPLTLSLQGQGAFVTGQNAAGKSTLLRSVGLNVVVGQALGFCYAQRALVPTLHVISSLQIEDSLGTATSLYMAELQRAAQLSAAARAPGGALCLVDEIFRGTNPQESVAATAALAHELAAGALVLLASHHRVLAPWLAADLQPLCVERDAAGVQSLRPGVLERTNGLAMLADHGFSAATQAVAARVFDWLQERSAGAPADADAPTLQQAVAPPQRAIGP